MRTDPVDTSRDINLVSNTVDTNNTPKKTFYRYTKRRKSKVLYVCFLYQTSYICCFFFREYYLWSIWKFITKPVIAFCIFTMIIILVCILAVYYTTPKESSMSYLVLQIFVFKKSTKSLKVLIVCSIREFSAIEPFS